MSISIILLFLNSRIENLARLGAAVSRYFLFLKKAHTYIFMIASKIFESGSAATVSEINAARREIDWQNFVSGVPLCASLAG